MAQDLITLNATLQYEDLNGNSDSLQVADLIKTFASRKKIRHTAEYTSSESALDLGGITSLGYILIVNMSPNYTCDIRVGTGGTIIARLDVAPETGKPGGFALFKIGSGITAPYIIGSGTGTVEYLLISA